MEAKIRIIPLLNRLKKIAKVQFILYFFVIFAKSFGKKFRTFMKFINDLTDRKGYENLSRAVRHPSVEIK